MLIDEIEALRRRGIDLSGLRDLGQRAPDHALPPAARPAGRGRLGKREIGTTKRGIGPCYADKAVAARHPGPGPARREDPAQKITAALEPKRQLLREFAKDPSLDLHQMTEDYRAFGDRLAPYIADTPPIAWDALDRGPAGGLRGRAGHAARHRPRHLSVRHLVEPGGGRRLRRRGRRDRRRSTRCGASRRPTAPAWARGPSPPSSTTRSATACARPAASSAPPPAARAAAAGSTWWRCATRCA